MITDLELEIIELHVTKTVCGWSEFHCLSKYLCSQPSSTYCRQLGKPSDIERKDAVEGTGAQSEA